MPKLKRLGILFSARLHAVVGAALGLIAGILYSFGGAIYDLSTSTPNSGTAIAFLALLGMPAIFAVCGFVFGIIAALLYNLVAKRFGGIELNIEEAP